MIKTVVLDFDGVVVNSNRLKSEAFFRIFEGGTGVSRDVVADVLRRNVGTRFDILRDIFVRSGAPEAAIAGLVDEGAARFDALVQDEIVSRGLAPGAADALAALGEKFCLYVNSATPESALRTTVSRLGISDRFRGVHGMPPARDKEENMRAILAREGIAPEESVMVGDGIGDLRCARACGARFVAVASGFYDWKKEAGGFPVAPGLREAAAMITAMAE